MLFSCYSHSCDADPAALAKYVIALAKKDKAESELKALCEDQLDVFLGEGKPKKCFCNFNFVYKECSK